MMEKNMVRKAKNNLRKTRKTNLSGHDVARVDGKWSKIVAPHKTVLVAENAPRLLLVIKNLGPSPLVLANGDLRELEIPADEIRACAAYGQVSIRNEGGGIATAIMEFTPLSKP